METHLVASHAAGVVGYTKNITTNLIGVVAVAVAAVAADVAAPATIAVTAAAGGGGGVLLPSIL